MDNVGNTVSTTPYDIPTTAVMFILSWVSLQNAIALHQAIRSRRLGHMHPMTEGSHQETGKQASFITHGCVCKHEVQTNALTTHTCQLARTPLVSGANFLHVPEFVTFSEPHRGAVPLATAGCFPST